MSFQIVYHNCNPDYQQKINELAAAFQSGSFELTVKSSGSTGKPKEIIHPKAHVLISAQRTNTFFGLNEDSRILCPISFDTIGGKMSLIRALAGNYEIHFTGASRSFIENVDPALPFDLVSLAPIQLSWIIENCGIRLKQFDNVLIGGASVSKDLEEKALKQNENCFLGFGMTETISHIALRRFGTDEYGLLPDISLHTEDGGTRITDLRTGLSIHSTDIIEKTGNHTFKWIGRSDFVINSGGVKIHPDQLEGFIQHELNLPVVIVGKADPEYGQKVVLVTETELTETERIEIRKLVERKFGKYAVPKQFIVHSFSYLNGLKLDRRTLKAAIDQLS